MKKNRLNPNSPIYHFSKTEIVEAIHSLRNNRETTQASRRSFPVTVLDAARCFRLILDAIIPHLGNVSLVMTGEKKKGKTTLACAIAMVASRMRIRETGRNISPGYRLMQDLDFLKDREGRSRFL